MAKGCYEDHGSGEETLLNVIRSYGMEIPPSWALDMSESLQLTIGYLLKDKWMDLEFKSYD